MNYEWWIVGTLRYPPRTRRGHMRRLRLLSRVVLCGFCLCRATSGCRDLGTRAAQSNPASALFDHEPAAKLSSAQVADVQILMAASYEKQNNFQEAMAAYQKAL